MDKNVEEEALRIVEEISDEVGEEKLQGGEVHP
jgi:hypothetical protein